MILLKKEPFVYLGTKNSVYDNYVDFQLRKNWYIADWRKEAWYWDDPEKTIPTPAWGTGHKIGDENLEPSISIRTKWDT